MKFKIGIIISSIIFASSVNASGFLSSNKEWYSSISPSNISVKSQSDNILIKKHKTISILYNLRIFKVLSSNSLVDSYGIYNDRSPLLDVNGELLVYAVGLSQVNIEKLKAAKIDGENIQIPKVKNLDSNISKLFIPYGKTA